MARPKHINEFGNNHQPPQGGGHQPARRAVGVFLVARSYQAQKTPPGCATVVRQTRATQDRGEYGPEHHRWGELGEGEPCSHWW